MAGRTGLILARYTWEGHGGLSEREQIAELRRLNDARPIAYRKSNPADSDFDTYIIRPSQRTVEGRTCLIWYVVRDVYFRQVIRADRANQTLAARFEETQEAEAARIVAIPSIGVLAADDITGDGHLGGWSALMRFREIVAQHSNQRFEPTLAGTPQDLQRAIDTWDLDQFSFQVRPFNPHPSNPGKVLSDLMATDGVGEFRAVAIPKEGAHIRPADEGIVKEAMGLAEEGYGTFGARGRTPSGAEAVVKKQSFSHDRQKNLERLRGPQTVRVYIDEGSEAQELQRIVRVLLDFFEPIRARR